MSAYCLHSDYTAAGVSDAAKTIWAQKASDIADGYICIKFQLPLVSWGADLTGYVAAIARYMALSDRGLSAENPADQLVVKNHDDAMRWLEGIARGVPRLNCVDSTPPTYESSIQVSSSIAEWRYNPRSGGFIGNNDE